jgi:hypothetical protein
MREHDAWFGHSSARVSRVLTKATSYFIALSLQPKEVGNDNRAEVKNDDFGSFATGTRPTLSDGSPMLRCS